MGYNVKEIFYSLQGEGAHSGRAAVFCRFSGCNLWSGLEKDREFAKCRFCDTDFVNLDGATGGKFDSALQLFEKVSSFWPVNSNNSYLGRPFVVFTGGEPALQLGEDLVKHFNNAGFETAVETNGTLNLPSNLDWICVSPKTNTEVRIRSGKELKLIFPQDMLDPVEFEHWDFEHFFLQPKSGHNYQENLRAALNYCLQNPTWRLGLQVHKIVDIP